MDRPAWLREPVAAAERGENPTVIGRMKSGFAVIAVTQFLPGYCLLLASPEVARLEDMPRDRRTLFLDEMGVLGEVVAKVCTPRRVNYAIYGNTAPYVHAHVVPRYEWEPADKILRPIWEYGPDVFNNPATQFSEEKHGAIKAKLAGALKPYAVG